MKILLDTCTFVWLIANAPELSPPARTASLDPENDVFLSSVSALEIAMKHRSGKIRLTGPPEVVVASERRQHGIAPLAFDEDSALYLGKLPPIHKDPFDRMLICQAIVHGMTILTPDERIRRYPVPTSW